MERRAGQEQGKKCPRAVAKGSRQDAEAPGEGRGALDTTPQLGMSEGESAPRRGRVSPSAPRCSSGKRGRSRFAAQPHPCRVGFHPTASSCGPGFARGSPRLVAAGDTGDVLGRGFNSNWEKIRSLFFFFFLTSALQRVTKCPGFGPSGEESFAIPSELSPAQHPPSPGRTPRTEGTGSPCPRLGKQPRPTAFFHPHPFPLMTTGTGEDLPGGRFKAEFLAETGRQPLPMVRPPPARGSSRLPCRNTRRGDAGGGLEEEPGL